MTSCAPDDDINQGSNCEYLSFVISPARLELMNKLLTPNPIRFRRIQNGVIDTIVGVITKDFDKMVIPTCFSNQTTCEVAIVKYDFNKINDSLMVYVMANINRTEVIIKVDGYSLYLDESFWIKIHKKDTLDIETGLYTEGRFISQAINHTSVKDLLDIYGYYDINNFPKLSDSKGSRIYYDNNLGLIQIETFLDTGSKRVYQKLP